MQLLMHTTHLFSWLHSESLAIPRHQLPYPNETNTYQSIKDSNGGKDILETFVPNTRDK